MTRFSSKWPTTPVRMTHVACGNAWDLYTCDWPPKITVCSRCATVLKLSAYDEATRRVTYRRL